MKKLNDIVLSSFKIEDIILRQKSLRNIMKDLKKLKNHEYCPLCRQNIDYRLITSLVDKIDNFINSEKSQFEQILIEKQIRDKDIREQYQKEIAERERQIIIFIKTHVKDIKKAIKNESLPSNIKDKRLWNESIDYIDLNERWRITEIEPEIIKFKKI